MHSRDHDFLTHLPYKVQGCEFKIGIFCDFSGFSRQKIIGGRGLVPIWVRRCKLHFPPNRLVSFMKIRSAVPENGCLIFMHYRVADGKKSKRQKNRL